MMLCGQLPFREQNDNATLFKILAVDYAKPPHLSQLSLDLLSRLLVR